MLNYYKKIYKKMESSNFVFYYVNLLYYKCHKTNMNRIESYLGSPD